MNHIQYVKSIMKYHNLSQIESALEHSGLNPNAAIAYLANLPKPPNIKSSLEEWFRYFDPKNTGGLTKDEIVCALHLSFGSDLRTVNFEKSVDSIWSQFVPAEFPEVKISLEVFVEPDGLGETIAEYIAPIYLQIDEIGSLFPNDVVVPRQHIHDVLLAHNGDKEKTIAELKQYYPLSVSSDSSSTPFYPSQSVPYQGLKPPSQQQSHGFSPQNLPPAQQKPPHQSVPHFQKPPSQHQYPPPSQSQSQTTYQKPPQQNAPLVHKPPSQIHQPPQQSHFTPPQLPPPQQWKPPDQHQYNAPQQPQLPSYVHHKPPSQWQQPSSYAQDQQQNNSGIVNHQHIAASLPQPPSQHTVPPTPPSQQQSTATHFVQSYPTTQDIVPTIYRPPANILPAIAAPLFVPIPPRKQAKQRALLVGINYVGQRGELKGCCNDVQSIKSLLTKTYGWSDNRHNMRILTDDSRKSMQPTKDNILDGLEWLVEDVMPGDALFFHYSGHGSQQPDPNGIEEDGMNEVIMPVDFNRNGVITDDEISSTIIHILPDGVRLTVVMDACHSGTGCDLPYSWDASKRCFIEDTNPYHSLGDVTLFSGCMDEGTSCDVQSTRGAGGAMTMAFVSSLQSNPNPTYDELLDGLLREMKRKGFKQKPQLSSSQEFDVGRPFLMNDALPNSNAKIGRTIRKKFSVGGGGKLDNVNASASELQTLLTSMLFSI